MHSRGRSRSRSKGPRVASPGVSGQYTVCNERGLAVREGVGLDSKYIGVVGKGEGVMVSGRCSGDRVEIVRPMKGWVSRVSRDGGRPSLARGPGGVPVKRAGSLVSPRSSPRSPYNDNGNSNTDSILAALNTRYHSGHLTHTTYLQTVNSILSPSASPYSQPSSTTDPLQSDLDDLYYTSPSSYSSFKQLSQRYLDGDISTEEYREVVADTLSGAGGIGGVGGGGGVMESVAMLPHNNIHGVNTVAKRVGCYLQESGVSEEGAKDIMTVFHGILSDQELMERMEWHVGCLGKWVGRRGLTRGQVETVGEPIPALESLFNEILRLIDAPASLLLTLVAHDPPEDLPCPAATLFPLISLFLATVYIYEVRVAPQTAAPMSYLSSACNLVSALEL